MKSKSYNRQFKKGNFPDEHWDESVRVNGHEVSPPSPTKKRMSIQYGQMAEARPGMVGKQDYKRKRGR